MQLVFNCNYYKDKNLDILVRVYENQIPDCEEEEQCAGEVLFKEHMGIDHERFLSWLPKGCAKAVVEILKKFEDKDVRVGIANEFPSIVGALTSCPENFDGALQREIDEQNLRVEE